jgi:hypothetical protein
MIFREMKIADTKLKKTFIIIMGFIIIAVLAIILLISPIAKFLIEKYDLKFTGRQIKTGLVYVNPFTGYIHINNLKIYEFDSLPDLQKNDSLFFSAKGVSANFAMLKMLSKTIEISQITIDKPKGIIIQNKRDLNFNDLIKKFTPKKRDTIPSKFHFNILGIKIKNGEFYYNEQSIPVNYFIKKVNFESLGIHWDTDTIAIKFSFLSGMGSGNAKGDLTINFKNLDYRLAAIVQKFDLKFIEQYIKVLTNYGAFRASLDADIQATGNFNDEENINARGMLAMNDFHYGKGPDDDYASFEKFVLIIETLSPKDHLYLFDSVLLIHPFLKYERYDYLDNLQMMFGKKGANISAAKANPASFNLIFKIADYVKVLAKNFFKSDYKVNKLAIIKGELIFNDYALTEKFSVEANPLNILADSVNRNYNWVQVSFKSGIQPYGNILINLKINPKDSGDFDMQYHLQGLPVSMFNPYLITYTSYPLDRGTLELNGSWKVRNSKIESDNHLLIIDPRITSQVKNNDTKWIPASLIMFFVRERGNVIDYEIPITGNLKDPKFHLKDAIIDILGNIFVKPASTNYRTEVKNIESEIENSLTLKWDIRQGSLLPGQDKFIEKMADFLIHDPKASIEVYPMQYTEKESENIQFFEARKNYFLLSKDKNDKTLNKEDSLKVENMSVKDPSFVKYLNKQVADTMLFTIQEKCKKLIGTDIIITKIKQLNKDRRDAFMLRFKEKAVDNRVKIYNVENTIPYNGFSFFKIVYKGELPESLTRAYQQMNDLDHKLPRKLFEKEREKNRKVI